MALQQVITSMLDDLSQQQPIQTALCIGQQVQYQQDTIQWQHFNASELLNLPFTQRYDLAVVFFYSEEFTVLPLSQQNQLLVKLRDLWAKRIVLIAHQAQTPQLRALGFQQLLDASAGNTAQYALQCWQFNILTYKQVPDWLNAKFWANPENWDKYRW
ncbi:DUF6231 family protein [Acinetobacter larvae]|uniref:Uncharacterized protein n=1 Tax=Acinetobacter larvae TaxID=1789224 RepID=A0A1B2M067_9GAMM|nr:DUF6231 family protein [Acinetobacter larvae]AOA58433.1 hypothetical protein BFG52_08750 [Acinetobacter larvae]